ncbi:hypothetical protein ON010_g10079 [Phytophthora cinnamomi]|nr:hypothetical protein ON010_g10079 [Phytophthora cinnamomi]
MKTYGNAPLGSKTHRTGASSDTFASQTDRGFSRDNSSSRFSPLKNNYLGTEGVTFVIPPPLSSSQSLEQPIVSRGTKTPTRPHSARLTPLVNERVKISTARFPNSAANASEWGSGDGEWQTDTSMNTGHLRPQTAVVVTKLSDPASRWDRPSDLVAGYRKNDRGDSRQERKRERGDSAGTSKAAGVADKKPRSPSSRRKVPSLSRSSSLDTDEDVNHGQYAETPRGPPVMDMDQSMAELREFAQQLLKEEARISSLLAQTGSKSPGLNRMSFSDKLHKMIEIAESSMYERSAAMNSSHGWSDVARTPPKTAEAARGDHAEQPTSIARDVTKPTREGTKEPSARTPPTVADTKIPVSDLHSAPKLSSSGYKKARTSTVSQKKQHKAPAKVGAVSPKADRKVVSKLDLKVRTPSIPFLEPLQVGPDKAPAKQDMDQEEGNTFNFTADTLSVMEDSPQKKEEEKDTICEESIQEEIPVTISPLDIPSNLEEKEDEPVPEHIDVKQEEEGYHDVDAITLVPSLHDAVEESPIVEEIGFVSPSKSSADSGKAIANMIANITQSPTSAPDDYEDDHHTFEPEENVVEIVPSLPVLADDLLQASKLTDEPTEDTFKGERPIVVSDAEVKGVDEWEHFTDPALLSESENKVSTFEPDARATASEEATPDGFAIPEAPHETHKHDGTWGRKSEEDDIDVPTVPSDDYCPVSDQKSDGAEIDGFEFIELPAANQQDLVVALDWPTARATCQELVIQGITDALVEVEAMGGVYILLPHEDTTHIDFVQSDNADDAEVSSVTKTPAGNNDDTADIQTHGIYSEIDNENTGDASSTAASDSALLSALQNVVSSLTPSTLLAQEILTNTIGQLTERDHHLSSSRGIQDDDFRIQQEPSEDIAGEIGRIVASTIAGSLSSAVDQLRSFPLGVEGGAEFSQSLNELVAVAVEAVAQRIRVNNELVVVPPAERFLPATASPVSSLALSLSNNNDSELSHRSDVSRIDGDVQLTNRSDTSRTDEGHVSVQMAKAIQDSVNGIIAMSLVSMVQKFEVSKHDQAAKHPESEVNDEAVSIKQVEKGSSQVSANEPALGEERRNPAGKIGNRFERALENGRPTGALSELTVMAVSLHDASPIGNSLLDDDVRKSDTSRSKTQKLITEPVDITQQENNAEEELSVQTVIAISRNVDGIIALSLEKTVKQLCSIDPIGTGPQIDDSTEGISPLSRPTRVNDIQDDLTVPTHLDQDSNAEHGVSDDVSLAIRRNISAIVAVTLESVLQRLQNGDGQLEQHTKDDGGQAPTRITETNELQLTLPDGTLAGPHEDGIGRTEQAPGQDFWDQDDATTDLEDLPVAMSISIQRSVNAILMQALQNVIIDLTTREPGVDMPHQHYEDEELRSRPFMSDEYNDSRDMKSVPYDHAAVMTAIETFDQLHQPDDDDNQTSDEIKGISIQTAIAVRWTVSGMIALAVENAIADSVLRNTAVDTVSEESKVLDSGYRTEAALSTTSSTAEADDIAKGISSDMAVAIRQTVDGIIERTTENVLSQIGPYTVKELVSQLVEATASADKLSVGGNAENPALTTRSLVAPGQVPEEEEPTLSIQMSLAIRQAVNGLIGLSLQAVIEDAMGKPTKHLLESERDESSNPVDSNLMEESRGLSESTQSSSVPISLLGLPFASVRKQLSDKEVESSEDETESVSVVAAIAVSRTVTAVIAAGVEKILDSMASVGASLAAGQDTALTSLTGVFNAVQVNEYRMQDESRAQLSSRSSEGKEHDVHTTADHDDAYEESLTPAMSIAVALSVRAILMEALGKVSQRIDLPRAYKDDIEFVNEEVLETPQLENTTDRLGYYRSLADENDVVATALTSVVNTMTEATLASISIALETHQVGDGMRTDSEPQIKEIQGVQATLDQVLDDVAEAISESQNHPTIPVDEVTTSDRHLDNPMHDSTEPSQVSAAAEDLVSAVESAARAAAEQEAEEAEEAVVETPVAVESVSETPEAAMEEQQEPTSSVSEDVAATAATAASVAVVAALSATVDAVEAESEYADEEFGDEQVTESVPEVTVDVAEEVLATEPAEVAATAEPSEVAAAVAQAVEAVSEAATEAEVSAAAEDLVSAVESAARAAAEQEAEEAEEAVVETPVAVESVSETPEAAMEEQQEPTSSVSEDVAATAATAASVAVVAALSATVDAVEAESEYADEEFGDEQVTESVPEVTVDVAEEVSATEPAEVAATAEPSEVAAAVAQAQQKTW